LGIVVGRAWEVVPAVLAVGGEYENVVGSTTIVVGSQFSEFENVAVGRMLVTAGSVVGGTEVVVSATVVGITVDAAVVETSVWVEFPIGTEPVGKVVRLPVGVTETVPLVTGPSVAVVTGGTVPLVVDVVLPTGTSVTVPVGMLVTVEPDEIVAVTEMSVDVALGSDPVPEVVVVSPPGSKLVRGGKIPVVVLAIVVAGAVEFRETVVSPALVLWLAGPGKRLLSKVPTGSKIPPLVVVVLLPTGGSTEATLVGSLVVDDTMPVGPMTIPDSVDESVLVVGCVVSTAFVVGRMVTLGKPDPEGWPPPTYTVLRITTVVTAGFFASVLDADGGGELRISEMRSPSRSRLVVESAVVSGLDEAPELVVMDEFW
jgi:hypothetical protein